MQRPSRATLTSFFVGLVFALSVVLLGTVMRQRVAPTRELPQPPAERLAEAPAPVAATAAPRDRGGNVYVMRSMDPAERALADARREHEEQILRAAAERRQAPSGSVADSENAPVREGAPVDEQPAAVAEQTEHVAPRVADAPTVRVSEAPSMLDGWWLVSNTIESTDYSPYAGLRLDYRVWLHREGDRVTGRGFKWQENGRRLPRGQRTPIFVSGTILGERISVRFVEHGHERVSEGRFQWTLSPNARLQGNFASDVANTAGRSEARRTL